MKLFQEEKLSKEKLEEYQRKVQEKYPTLTSVVRELYLPTKTNLLIGNIASLMSWRILRGRDKFFNKEYVSEYLRYNFLDLVLENKLSLVDAVNENLDLTLDSYFDPEAEGTSLYDIFTRGMAYLEALSDKIYDNDMYMALYVFDSYLITYFNSPKIISLLEKQGFNYFLEHKKAIIINNW